ncbi:MAG: PKD domain-containing protein [Planctomycetota bacterium]|nr:MAG: PKD domain-containing protein [Planctomycetota bacterium]
MVVPVAFNNISHQYLDSGAFTISATVTDNDNGSVTSGIGVTVSNGAPSNVLLTLNPATIDENGSTTLSGSFGDPDSLNTHSVVINWGDGSSNTTLNLAAGVLTFGGITHQYLDNGSHHVSASVTNKNGAGSGSATLTVNNVTPANVNLTLASASINENDSATLSGTFTDPGTLDTHTVLINWGDGSANTTLALGAGVLSFGPVSHQYLDNLPSGSTYPITATVTDKDKGSGQGNTNITVNNVAPANVQLSLSATAINENDSTSLSGSFTDPGTLDTHAVVINWGDGSSDTLDLAAGVLNFSNQSHQYLDDPAGGVYGISVTVTDNNNASGLGATSVTVNNVAPSGLQLALSANSIPVNNSVNLSGTFADPGTLDTHSVLINWGDGASTPLNLAAGVLSFSNISHSYTSAGSFTIGVTVTDNDGAFTTASAQLQVTSITTALSASITGPSTGVRGQQLTFTLTVTGAAPGDAIQYNIDWNGDGHVEQTVTGGATQTVQHVFTHSGQFTINLTAMDLTAGTSATASTQIRIRGADLQNDPLNPGTTMLVVGGTMHDDDIDIEPASREGSVRVRLNDDDLGTFTPTSRIVVFAQDGGKSIRVSGRVHVSAWLFGGSGDDYLEGGGGDNVLVGGAAARARTP